MKPQVVQIEKEVNTTYTSRRVRVSGYKTRFKHVDRVNLTDGRKDVVIFSNRATPIKAGELVVIEPARIIEVAPAHWYQEVRRERTDD